ncbi:MAG: DUF308 domain-containing protein [Treponema sp.]|nr:DUF308 domain-containing protein [Treponema sp.]
MRLKSFFLGLVIFVVGLLMTIMPQKIFNAIIIMMGVVAIADGIYSLIKITKEVSEPEVRKPVIIRAVCCIVIGAAAASMPIIFKGAIDTVCMIFGFILAVSLVVYAAFGFFTAGKLANDDATKKNLTTESLISLLIAIILFILPIKNITTTITRVIGIIGLVAGLIIAAYEIFLFINHKNDGKDAVEVVEVADDEEKTGDKNAKEATGDKNGEISETTSTNDNTSENNA